MCGEDSKGNSFKAFCKRQQSREVMAGEGPRAFLFVTEEDKKSDWSAITRGKKGEVAEMKKV